MTAAFLNDSFCFEGMTVKLHTAFTLYLGCVSPSPSLASRRWPKAHPCHSQQQGMCTVALRMDRATSPALGKPLLLTFPQAALQGEYALGMGTVELTHKISQRPFIDHSRNIPTLFFGCCILQCVHLKYIRGRMWIFQTIAKRTLDEIKTEKHAQVNLLKIQGLNVTFLTWKNSSVYLTKTFY